MLDKQSFTQMTAVSRDLSETETEDNRNFDVLLIRKDFFSRDILRRMGIDAFCHVAGLVPERVIIARFSQPCLIQ